jgi:uncharacterized protein (TIRG00374 family)
MIAKARHRRGLRYARVAVALVLLLILLPTLTQPQFLSTFAHVNLPLAGLAFALSLASVAAKAQRWGIVLRARGVNVTYQYLLTSYFVGLFFNNFLPSGLGGDAVRAYDSAHATGRSKEAITAVILERGSGMLVVFGGGSLLALFQPNLPLSIALLAHGLFVGTLLGLFLLWQDFTGELLDWIRHRVISHVFNGRLDTPWRKFVNLYQEFRSYRRERRLLVILLAQAILTQALAIVALGYAPPFGAFSAVTGIGTSLDLVPISLNSLGVREGVYVYFLGLLAIPGPAAAAFAVSIRLVALLQALLGGLLFLWRSVRPAARSSATLTSSGSTTTPERIARG